MRVVVSCKRRAKNDLPETSRGLSFNIPARDIVVHNDHTLYQASRRRTIRLDGGTKRPPSVGIPVWQCRNGLELCWSMAAGGLTKKNVYL